MISISAIATACCTYPILLPQASGERPIERKRGSLRPVISVWRGDELISAIECKTQLGWNRSGWDQDFAERQARLQSRFPNSQAFLLVLTGINWSGFEHDPRLGTQLFVLSRLWPTDVTRGGKKLKSLIVASASHRGTTRPSSRK